MLSCPHILRNDVYPLLACLAAVAAMPFVGVRPRGGQARGGWSIRRYPTPLLSVPATGSDGGTLSFRRVSDDSGASSVTPFPLVADLAAFVRLTQLVAARLGGLYGP